MLKTKDVSHTALLAYACLCLAPKPGAKAWPDSDPNRFETFVQLGRDEPQVVIDGEERNYSPIAVKPGSIVHVEFPERYGGSELWWFAGAQGEIPQDMMFAVDFRPDRKNGRPLPGEPGTKILKFKAPEQGAVFSLCFKYGRRVDGDGQLNQSYSQLATIFIRVE